MIDDENEYDSNLQIDAGNLEIDEDDNMVDYDENLEIDEDYDERVEDELRNEKPGAASPKAFSLPQEQRKIYLKLHNIY